jgi:hypothetical protein
LPRNGSRKKTSYFSFSATTASGTAKSWMTFSGGVTGIPWRSASALCRRNKDGRRTRRRFGGQRELLDTGNLDDSQQAEVGQKGVGAEEICGDGRADDGILEAFVKWKRGRETRELYEDVAQSEKEGIAESERLHGQVAGDAVPMFA